MNTIYARINEDRLIQLRGWRDQDAAAELDYRVQDIEVQEKRTFVELGLICCEVQDRELYRYVIDRETGEPYRSAEAWMAGRLRVCLASAFEAKRAVRALRDVPLAEMECMPRFALRIAGKLSSASLRRPVVIEALKNSTEAELQAFVEREIPEAHLEKTSRMVFRPDRSQREIIEGALLATGAGTREEQLEALAVDYMVNRQEEA
jgi:hypothetical protein